MNIQFDHILIRYGELGLKGKNIKQFLISLQHHIQHKLRDFKGIKVKRTQGRMFVLLNGHEPEPVLDILQHVFGIKSMSLAIKVENTLEDIQAATLFAIQEEPTVKTFKISAKRTNKDFPHGSQEMNQILGGHVLVNCEDVTVDVHHPDLEIKVEIRNEATYITSKVVPGLGGLPVGTSNKTLLLLSGGIDSPVAGYLAMKRGVSIEAIHFHSPPFTSERAKQKVLDIAKKLTKYGINIKIHMVPFTKLQQAIFEKIPENFAMTVMRRMMLKISERVCRNEGIMSIATGENLGQVASQTMESMYAINAVTNLPILRPLITMDKDEIVQISREIDTFDISIRPYEDCCTVFVPKAPKTKPNKEKVEAFEAQFDYTELLNEAYEGIEVVTVTDQEEKTDVFDDLL